MQATTTSAILNILPISTRNINELKSSNKNAKNTNNNNSASDFRSQ